MFSRKLAVAALAAGMAVSAAIACGPDFPWQLLDRREETLATAPANSFAFEMKHLLRVPSDGLTPGELEASWNDAETARAWADDLARAERVGLSAAQGERLAVMRAAASGDTAFALGPDLPPAVRLYTAGAVAFRGGDREGAAERFTAVLALPGAERGVRTVWAAYMLGRIAAEGGDVDAAQQAFAQTRDLARGGAPDPQSLAVASFGEEGRALLNHADAAWKRRDADAFGRATAAAVALYVEQAVRGSDGGVQSLRMVAERLLDDPPRLDAAVGDPLVQRLLVAYAAATTRFPFAFYASETRPPVDHLVDALQRRGVERVAGLDRVASFAYAMGRYDVAARAAERASGPLASWVKAKLAVRAGNLDGAAALLAEASRAFPESGGAVLDEASDARLEGERGALALARGEYVNALELLHPVALRYWGDVAHIAERVLTVDELKVFVDRKGEIPAGESNYWTSQPPSLRDLLARRLMREGRTDEALAYFARREVAEAAATYAKALHAARDGWWPFDRARAFHEAALLARHRGLEMMGTEGPPDLFAYGGAFGGGLGQETLEGSFVTDGERRRFEESRATPDQRWHYRYIATDLETAAADRLPRRSQAFAAVLCHATHWMLQTREKDRAQALYARYVAEGAAVDWADDFGQDCPEPDFDGAVRGWPRYVWLDVRGAAHAHKAAVLAIAGALLVAGAAVASWFLLRRRSGGGQGRITT
ncbi:hypothetical protein [Azospirillum canadense]|uniref:hypothetical protein n=1 Tax=Azospirillum canadense TaxID=403962 RepID=UPI002227D19C|nr:hypothetical protein [Azospirillum canadense]MCW2238029.1 tetratricopeptide (TPR) repeat protein [Azospirillum canadense]